MIYPLTKEDLMRLYNLTDEQALLILGKLKLYEREAGFHGAMMRHATALPRKVNTNKPPRLKT